MKANTIAPFKLYQASAGAGKTFLLVQQFLVKLLSSKTEDRFHRMLALTFTNKAVFEMKFRLLKKLHFLAFTEDELSQDPMGEALLVQLGITPRELSARARVNLHLILHDYAAFDVITLDSFTHRVIRSFAKDLGLAYNFDVELQSERILEEVVERVIDQVGEAPQLTKLLEAFTFQKMDDEAISNWDLKSNLLATAKLLLNENDRDKIIQFMGPSDASVDKQYNYLLSKRENMLQAMIDLGKKVMILFAEEGLIAEHFNRQTLFNRFSKLSKGDFERFDTGKLHENLKEGKRIYLAKTPEHIKKKIEALLPRLLAFYEQGLFYFYRWHLLSDVLKQWIPLNMLATLARTLALHQTETNRVLLSTFNERIAQEVLGQPSPYIYERLGENYRHYFLDEFQDTSSLQWKNLIPLIKSSLESESESGQPGSLLIVGDPKQSIYRWRGGNVEQFIDLLGDENPFTIEKEEKRLSSNYRSSATIVAFNNGLYQVLGEHLTHDANKILYGSQSLQNPVNKDVGFVRMSFLSSVLDEKDPFAVGMVNDIKACKMSGYNWSDMAILVRTRKQAQSIGRVLKMEKLPFSSSESLVLGQSKQVEFLMTLLYLHHQPKNLKEKKKHLSFLYEGKDRSEDLHTYLQKNLPRALNKIWQDDGIDFSLDWFDQRTLYTVLQRACSHFQSLAINDVFVAYFLDEVFELSCKDINEVHALIHYWEHQLMQKTIPAANSQRGIRLMTIHQAKGLEFPLVFFPYADRPIHPKTQERLWLNTTDLLGGEIPLVWINQSSRLQHYGSEGELAYEKKLKEEEIDAWNVFYVATTRACEQLYIYADKQKIDKHTYASLLAKYAEDCGRKTSEDIYEWGEMGDPKELPSEDASKEETASFFSAHPYEERLMLQYNNSKKNEEARNYGIKIHELLSRIDFADEVTSTLAEATFRGEITKTEEEEMKRTLDHLVYDSAVAPYFSRAFTVWNEQSILVPNTKILRPDRIVFNDEKTIVIDYKTGNKSEKHITQIKEYVDCVLLLFNRPVEAYLVYIDKKGNNELKTINVSQLASSE